MTLQFYSLPTHFSSNSTKRTFCRIPSSCLLIWMSFLGLFLGCSKPRLSFGSVLLKCSLTYLVSSWLLFWAPSCSEKGQLSHFLTTDVPFTRNSSHLSPLFLWLCWCPSTILQKTSEQVSSLNLICCCWKSIVMFWMTELCSNVPCHYPIVWDRQSLHHLHMSHLQKLNLSTAKTHTDSFHLF